MKNSISIIIFLIFLSVKVLPQGGGVISGRVIDITTKEPVPGANILVEGTNAGAAAGIDGSYSVQGLAPGVYQLRVSAVGYMTIVKTDISVSGVRPEQADFELQPQAVELEDVTVRADYFSKNPVSVISTKTFSYEEIRRAPGGFEDVVRALSVLPGVAQADAGRNDLIVRGGAPSENLYLVDGIEVPNINHFGTQGATGGPLSFINLDYVKETTFSTGGFPVLYGDRLSSVLSIDLREGRSDRIGGKATISASQFGLNLEGPMGDKGSYIFSARRSYLDFIFKAAGFGFVPEYYDALSKINYQPDNRNTFSFLFIGAFDNVKFFNDTQEQRFDNSRILGSDQIQYVTGISYSRLIKDGYFKLSLSRNYTDYDSFQRDSLLNPLFQNKSLEAENALRGDLIYKPWRSSEINIGGNAKLIKFRADILFPTFVTSFGDTLPFVNLNAADNFIKAAGYVNYNLVAGRVTANAGIRLDYFDPINEKLYLSPRLSLSYMINALTNLNFSTGIYYQAPSYIWLIAEESNKDLKAVRSDQFVLGFDHRLTADALLKVEAFYKDYKDYPASALREYLVLANTGAGYGGSEGNFSSFGLEPLVSAGRGRARGVELSIQKKLSDTPYYGLLSLTYSNVDFKALDGIERKGDYEQEWIFNISGGYKFDAEWEASMKFRYASGPPYTPFNGDGSQNVVNYNLMNVDANHSLDLRLDKRWFFEKWTLTTYVDVQNVYNRKNRNTVRWNSRTGAPDEGSSIGLLPTIGVSLEF